jgi:hypothetical protein
MMAGTRVRADIANLLDAERWLYGHQAETACPAPDLPSTVWAVNDGGERAESAVNTVWLRCASVHIRRPLA